MMAGCGQEQPANGRQVGATGRYGEAMDAVRTRQGRLTLWAHGASRSPGAGQKKPRSCARSSYPLDG